MLRTRRARAGTGAGSSGLANAGLPHPFILRACARRVEEVRLGGRPLGLLDIQGEVRAELAGQEGRNVIDRLVTQVIDFGRSRPLPDDINLVAVPRNGREALASGG